MTIIFGLELDEGVAPDPPSPAAGVFHAGPQKLMALLEKFLGLEGHTDNIEYLRIEQYRQALKKYLQASEKAFFQRSFEADQFATAADLLARRDELLLSGWDFSMDDTMPSRLKSMAVLERTFQEKDAESDADPLLLTPGFADRFKAIYDNIEGSHLPIEEIRLNEPLAILPIAFQRLFEKLQKTVSITQIEIPESEAENGSDLENLQISLTEEENGAKKMLQNDGSLIVVKARRSIDAAAWMARLMAKNPDFRPACLIPGKNRQIDDAIIREGMPGLGIVSASLARPSLQILKLAPAFLWEPADPFKILEFVTLGLKPLDDGLSQVIAKLLAQSPGLNSEIWNASIQGYFEKISLSPKKSRSIKPGNIRKDYEFWFGRKRYDVQETVPKEEAAELFTHIRKWAFKKYDESGSRNNSLLVLGEQSGKIADLLHTLPEPRLSYLELERVVRTVYEPSPVAFGEEEAGRMAVLHHPSSLCQPVDQLLWWNFTEDEGNWFFSKWYEHEKKYLLDQHGVKVDSPDTKNRLLMWQRLRPFLLTKRQLALVMPESVEGEAVNPHPLWSDILAGFSNPEAITVSVDDPVSAEKLQAFFTLPEFVDLEPVKPVRPEPFIRVKGFDGLQSYMEFESPTSIEDLLYYPYKWVFRHKLKLVKSPILSVVKDNTLLGNLAHRLFENLLKQNFYKWNKDEVEQWIARKIPSLLSKEGSTLLMYGMEPEKINFENKMKYAAWSLISIIRQNDWKVKGTEMEMIGMIGKNAVRGIADIILEREEETAIIDLKWRGLNYRTNLLRNEEDLQLVMYSRLYGAEEKWPHTAYFIVEKGKLITRHTHSFKEAVSLASEGEDPTETQKRIFQKMILTQEWRIRQLEQGIVEIRNSKTAEELEERYSENGEEMMKYLEMKVEDAPFDDYKTLLNLMD